MFKSVLQNVQIFAKIAKISVFATLSVSSADDSLPVKPLSRDCREMPKKVFNFSNELIDNVIGIS